MRPALLAVRAKTGQLTRIAAFPVASGADFTN